MGLPVKNALAVFPFVYSLQGPTKRVVWGALFHAHYFATLLCSMELGAPFDESNNEHTTL